MKKNVAGAPLSGWLDMPSPTMYIMLIGLGSAHYCAFQLERDVGVHYCNLVTTTHHAYKTSSNGSSSVCVW